MNKKETKVFILAIVFLAIDLMTKSLVLKAGNVLYKKTIIKDFFSLHFTKNTGAAFSFLTGYSWIFVIIAFIFLFIIIRFFIYQKNLKQIEVFAYSLLLGGVMGNLIDRIINGYVIDFLSFKIFDYYFPIFNLADTFIVIGAGLLIIDIVRGSINENRSKKWFW